MPTILSRVRPYTFIKRTKDEEQEVLRRVFKHTSDLQSLENFGLLPSFFYTYLPTNYEIINKMSFVFWKYIFLKVSGNSCASLKNIVANYEMEKEEDLTISSILNEINKCKPSIIYELFLQCFINVIHLVIIEGGFEPRELEIFKLILEYTQKAKTKVELFNLNVQSVLEELVFEIREALK